MAQSIQDAILPMIQPASFHNASLSLRKELKRSAM